MTKKSLQLVKGTRTETKVFLMTHTEVPYTSYVADGIVRRNFKAAEKLRMNFGERKEEGDKTPKFFSEKVPEYKGPSFQEIREVNTLLERILETENAARCHEAAKLARNGRLSMAEKAIGLRAVLLAAQFESRR